ncbi:uncharacterized protein EDB91DRAFT_1084504 [Suillus paluster]|uniref:uncharacterized protein n=1 Tax=Suillus paluster TaxID=48578 RepID=UPI001B86E88B|nr:uncharacterized protein EDB91DRAFT_1084504 [Suillus paluster]KAG1733228.1 hypothetical protein EDB91DRAFT_1084504 [Suillus paluster]
MLPADGQTCRGKTNDGSQCPCLRPKLRKDQKDNEPAICVNCGHYDTSHPQEVIPQQPPTSSSFGVSEDIAHRETNVGFRKQDLALSAATNRTAKVGVHSSGSKDVIKVKMAAANLRKTGIGSIVMVTVGVNRKGCMKRKIAPDTAKIEELRRLKLAVSKGPDGDDLQFAPGMTKSDVDGYLRTLFPHLFDYLENHNDDRKNSNSTLAGADGFRWYLIVKSGKNMVKSSQEGLTGSDILRTHHSAGRKWTDQFIYFGTMLEVDPDSFDDSMSEVVEAEDIDTVGSDDMDESENEAPVLPKGKGFAPSPNLKNELDPVVPSYHSHGHERTKRPQRKRRRVISDRQMELEASDLGNTTLADTGIELAPVMLDVPAAMSTLKNLDGDKRSSVAQIDVTQLESEPGMLGDVGLIPPAEDKPTLNMPLDDSESSTLPASVTPADEYYNDYYTDHTIGFGTPREYMLVPSASESSSTSTTMSTASASISVFSTHAAHGPGDLGSSHPRNLQALGNVP